MTHRRLEVPQQPGRELASADQGPGTGDETLRLGWAGPTFLFAFGSIREHFRPRRHLISAPEWRTEMTNRFGLEPDHYRRGLKDAVSQHLRHPVHSYRLRHSHSQITRRCPPDSPGPFARGAFVRTTPLSRDACAKRNGRLARCRYRRPVAAGRRSGRNSCSLCTDAERCCYLLAICRRVSLLSTFVNTGVTDVPVKSS